MLLPARDTGVDIPQHRMWPREINRDIDVVQSVRRKANSAGVVFFHYDAYLVSAFARDITDKRSRFSISDQ